MAHDEITYEKSLETMTEDGLRRECIILRKELDKVQGGVLTEPVSGEFVNGDTYFSIDRIKECLTQIREHHTIDPSDVDLAALMNIVDRVIVAVSSIDGKVKELSDQLDTGLHQPVRGSLFRDE